MTAKEERAYEAGRRAVRLEQLREALADLGAFPLADDAETARLSWVVERQQLREYLRRTCAELGAAADWPDALDLRDVIEKHLMPAIERHQPGEEDAAALGLLREITTHGKAMTSAIECDALDMSWSVEEWEARALALLAQHRAPGVDSSS